MFGCRKGTSSAAASVVSEGIDPTAAMAVFTNGIGFGHFHYVAPVATGGKYTLKLHFMEHWFGVQNGGIGGVGSRGFDVFCNGSMLLRGFDIFRESGSEPLVKSFPHIEPTPQGKIEIYFTPAVNYPSISAI